MIQLNIDRERAVAMLKKKGVAWPLVILLLSGGGGGAWSTFCSQVGVQIQIQIPENDFLKFVPGEATPGAPGLPGVGPP